MKVVLSRSGEAPAGDTPTTDSMSLGRFLEEAQVTSQLDHPGIVPVHELGVDAGGRVYFTMKLVKGEDLRAVFDQVADPADEEWTRTRALNVLLRVCEAMAFAHEKGVVHRDLKPANIMVGRFGETYVMDWGLARILGEDDPRDLRLDADLTSKSVVRSERQDEAAGTPDSPLLTMDGHVVGTPAYMPPEQAEGRLEDVGPPSDVYAMGAITYQLLSGQMPYVKPGTRVSPRTILARVLDGPPEPIKSLEPNVPSELAAICDKAMARESGDRYPTMAALADDLRAFLDVRVVAAYETGSWAELKKWVRRNAAQTLTAAAAVAAVTILTTWFILKLQTERDAARDALAESRRSLATAHLMRAKAVISQTEVFLNAARSIDLEDSAEARDLMLSARPHVSRPLWTYPMSSDITAIDRDGTGETLAVGLTDGTVHLVDVERRVIIAEFHTGNGSMVTRVGLDSEAKRLFALSYDGYLHSWDTTSPSDPSIAYAGGGYRAIADYRLSSDGSLLAHCDYGAIEVYDARSLELVASKEDIDVSDVGCLANDGSMLARWLVDGTYEELSLPDLRRTRTINTDRKRESMGVCSFSPDGRWVLAADRLRLIVMDRTTFDSFEVESPLENCSSFGWAPDCSCVIGFEKGSRAAVIWETNTWKVINTHDSAQGGSVVGSLTSQGTFVTGGMGQQLCAWTTRSATWVPQDASQVVSGSETSRVAFHAKNPSRIGVIDAEQARVLWTESIDSKQGRLTMALSPDGTLLAHPESRDHMPIVLTDAQSGKRSDVLRGEWQLCHALAFSPDGARLASGHDNGRVAIWDLGTRERIVDWATGEIIMSLYLHEDGERISVQTVSTVELRNVKDGSLEERHEIEAAEVVPVSRGYMMAHYLPTSQRLRVVDTRTGIPQCEFVSGFANCFSWSGRSLTSSGGYATDLLDIDGELLTAIVYMPVSDTAFLPGDDVLIVANEEGVFFVDLTVHSWAAGDCLRRAEEIAAFRLDGFKIAPRLPALEQR